MIVLYIIIAAPKIQCTPIDVALLTHYLLISLYRLMRAMLAGLVFFRLGVLR
jgi:hypothetical protein